MNFEMATNSATDEPSKSITGSDEHPPSLSADPLCIAGETADQGTQTDEPSTFTTGSDEHPPSSSTEPLGIARETADQTTQTDEIKPSQKQLNFCRLCEKTVQRFWEHMSLKHKGNKKVYAILCITNKKKRIMAIAKYRKECKEFYNQKNPSNPLTERKISNSKRKICILCKEEPKKFWSHMITHHSTAEKVVQIVSIEDKQKRKKEIRKLCQEFTSTDLASNSLSGSSQSIPLMERLGQCSKCSAFVTKSNLKRHIRNCSFVSRLEASCAQIADDCEREVSREEQVLLGGRMDALQKIYAADELITMFVKHKCVGVKWSSDRASEIRSSIRKMTKVFLHMQKIDSSIVNFECIFHPDKWSVFKQALFDFAGVNERGEVKHPSVLTSVGFFVRTLHKVYKVRCTGHKFEQLTKWYEFYELEHYLHVVKTGLQTAKRRNRNVISVLPLASDVTKLHEFLQKKADQLSKDLKKSFCHSKWREFNKCLATLLMVCNKKRLREIPSMPLAVYLLRHKVPITEDYIVSEIERHRANMTYRLEIEGKGGNTVYLLMTDWLVGKLDQLVTLRTTAGVPDHCKLMFSSTKGNRIDLNKAVSQFSVEANCEQPNLLRSRKMRKKTVQKTQRMNLHGGDRSALAKFMGHSERTFENHYNLPDGVVQVARVSGMLNAELSNRTEDFHNKDLKSVGSTPKQGKSSCDQQMDEGETTDENDESVDDESVDEESVGEESVDEEGETTDEDYDSFDEDETDETGDTSDKMSTLSERDEAHAKMDENDTAHEDGEPVGTSVVTTKDLETPDPKEQETPSLSATPSKSPMTPSMSAVTSCTTPVTSNPSTSATPCTTPVSSNHHQKGIPRVLMTPHPRLLKIRRERVNWTPKETRIVKTYFAKNLRHENGISLEEARICRLNNPRLRRRNPQQIVDKVKNLIKKTHSL